MNDAKQTTKVIRRDIVKAEDGTFSVVVIRTNNTPNFWHDGFATKAAAKNFARWS